MTETLTLSLPDLLRSLVSQHKPQTLLQVGVADTEPLEVLCEAVQDAGATLTLVAPQLFTDARVKTALKSLKQKKLDQVLELIGNPADQALPDFFFQEQVYNMAVMNSLERYEENFVAFYYLNKLLPEGACVVINSAGKPAMRRLLRDIINGKDFIVSASYDTGIERPRVERILRARYQKLPGFVRERVEEFLRPEFVTPDDALGIGGDVVVLKKIGFGPMAEMDVEQMIAALV